MKQETLHEYNRATTQVLRHELSQAEEETRKRKHELAAMRARMADHFFAQSEKVPGNRKFAAANPSGGGLETRAT